MTGVTVTTCITRSVYTLPLDEIRLLTVLKAMSEGKKAPIPPTLRLPPVGKILSTSVEELTDAVNYLSDLYNPEVQGIQYISRRQCLLVEDACASPHTHNRDSNPRRKSDASIKVQSSDVERDAIRADSFERTYVVQWLTALISRTGHLSEEVANWESVIQHAAGLLAIYAGAASAGIRSRIFAFPSRRTQKTEIVKVQINDLPLDNQDYSSVGAQTWGGACLLADIIVTSPREFGLVPRRKRDLRVLELGAGTGLVGLAAGRLLLASGVPSKVVTTDFHPTVLKNLRDNIALNSPPSEAAVSVSAHFLDWSTFSVSASEERTPPFDDAFDVIYGADIIYELEHAKWIKACVETLLRKPSRDDTEVPSSLSSPQDDSHTATNPRFHLAIPSRSTHAAESRTVEDTFPLACALCRGIDEPLSSPTLAITAKEMIVCGDMWEDGSREIEYVLYTISWV